MATNRGVVYMKQGVVEVQSIAAPVMANPAGRKLAHAAILKIVVTNSCGSDHPATVLNSLMEITRAAGRLGIPGL